MAAHDLFAWRAQIAQSLPAGQGAVDVDPATTPTTYTVTVSWAEPTQVAPVTFAFAFQLPVY
jgi:hypothetical protein